MKKTLTTIVLLTGSLLFCQVLMAQGNAAGKTAPDGKPVLTVVKDQASKSSVASEKPTPPLSPIVPANGKTIQQADNKNAEISAAPVSPQIKERDLPGEGAPKLNIQEPAAATPTVVNQNVPVIEKTNTPVKEQPKIQKAPIKND